MSKEKELKVKEVVEEQKKALKKVKEKEVIIDGVSESEANAINTVLYYVGNAKTQPQANLKQGLEVKSEVEEELTLLYAIEKELNAYNNTGKTLRIVRKRIKMYEENIETKILPPIKALENHIKFIDDTIEKINSNITETESSDKVFKIYDENYFRPILDVAYVLFEVKKSE